MDIQGFFTKKGLLLAAKLAAGSTLKITRVCAGAAETALTASALFQIRQTLSVGAARRNGDTAVLPVTVVRPSAGLLTEADLEPCGAGWRAGAFPPVPRRWRRRSLGAASSSCPGC